MPTVLTLSPKAVEGPIDPPPMMNQIRTKSKHMMEGAMAVLPNLDEEDDTMLSPTSPNKDGMQRRQLPPAPFSAPNLDDDDDEAKNDHDEGDYGYEDAAPNSRNYDYEDAAPDSHEYGYEDAAPDSANSYGYEDAAPDSANRYGYEDASPDSANNYGYEDAAPDSANSYGYEDAAPDRRNYGYEDAAPDSANQYGYGDAAPDSANQYGYGDATPDSANQYGYEDATPQHGGYNAQRRSSVNNRMPRRSSMKQQGAPRRASISYTGEVAMVLPGSKKPVVRRTSISFADNTEVQEVAPAKTLAKQPEKLWYQDKEYACIKQKIRVIVQYCDTYDKRPDKTRGAGVEPGKLCTRGLERHMSGGRKWLEARYNSLDMVLDEQDLQRDEGCFDEQTISQVYEELTVESKNHARHLADQDAKDIEQYTASTRRLMTQMRRCSM